jgi:hypothetical protein
MGKNGKYPDSVFISDSRVALISKKKIEPQKEAAEAIISKKSTGGPSREIHGEPSKEKR